MDRVLVFFMLFISKGLWASDAFPSRCELSLIGLNNIASLPVASYKAGDIVITDGSRTGLLLILKKGSVAIVKNNIEIAKVTEPGSVIGELSALLDKPHTADVRVLESSEFYVANAETLLFRNPVALGYISAIMAGRLDAANETLVELKTQIRAGMSRNLIAQTVEKLEEKLQSPTKLR